ncbi:YceH family protein [Gemmata sp. JC717]|uniref:YceH family protein n=1 Tax=Gemmata algarum TaxID=2975278 RepID=A0ABU5F2D3_9BACT|nr:YceH family protein [Gemmata algarum]MDY3553984.1 YceH family protein [Gemmata algarum]MDY3561500.1 YceH family protein [Gemmata algarum]
MSSDAPPAPEQPPAPAWVPLSPLDRRILGVLIEKQKTSKNSDSYPLTLNALVTGCNQKSNRDPVVELNEIEVEDGLESLQERGFVTRIEGGRTDRYRHEMYNLWTQSGPGIAVLAELLLRGAQTKGDLRTRAARMAPIDTLDALEEVLQPLVERRLVVYLTGPDRRGAVVTHGFHTGDELIALKALHAGGPVPISDATVPAVRSAPPGFDARLTAALAEIEALKARVTALETQLAPAQKPPAPTP